MFSRKILLALPLARSTAMYTLLRKLITITNSSTAKYCVPTAISSPGVPARRRNRVGKGRMAASIPSPAIRLMAYTLLTRRRTSTKSPSP